MNCNYVQELLPLYVGRDLEERRAKLVMAHVQSCAECACALDEYRETRELLQQFAPPLFSEAVYAGIRQRVLHEIEREAPAPGLSRLFASLFRPRLGWAVAIALLLAVGVSAFYFITNRNIKSQIANNGAPVEGPNSPSNKKREVPLPPSTVKNEGSVPLLAGTHQPQRRKSRGATADRTTSVAANTPAPRSTNVQTSAGANNLAEPDAVPAGDSATPDKTLRVEMQTNDPNIRIIWFTHQPTKQDSPSKFSKGI